MKIESLFGKFSNTTMFTTLYTMSIEIGAQPDELFEVPSGYTEMKMPY